MNDPRRWLAGRLEAAAFELKCQAAGLYSYLCIPSGKTRWLALAPVWEEHHTHYANCPCECHLDQVGLFRGAA